MGGSEVLKLKATFFADWKKFLVGEKGSGNLPRLPGAKKKKHKYFVPHTTYRYSGDAVGDGDDDIEHVKDETPKSPTHSNIRGGQQQQHGALPPNVANIDDDDPYGPAGNPNHKHGGKLMHNDWGGD